MKMDKPWKVTVDEDDFEDTIGVYVNGVELGRYCIVDNPERERKSLENVISRCCEAESDAALAALDAIAELCGCPQWDYAGQVVRDVHHLKATAISVEDRNQKLLADLEHLRHEAGPSSCADFAKRGYDAEVKLQNVLAKVRSARTQLADGTDAAATLDEALE